MTDRELLELAAKAAGIQGKYNSIANEFYLDEDFIHPCKPEVCWWNPLTDDGDALRLAVKLEIDLQFNHGSVIAIYALGKSVRQGLPEHYWTEDSDAGQLRQEATRRAIVRAAAEIGRSMK